MLSGISDPSYPYRDSELVFTSLSLISRSQASISLRVEAMNYYYTVGSLFCDHPWFQWRLTLHRAYENSGTHYVLRYSSI